MTGQFISLVEHLIIGKPIAFYRRYDTAQDIIANESKR